MSIIPISSFCFHSSPSSVSRNLFISTAVSSNPVCMEVNTTTTRSVRIAVVGDTHDDWDLEEDAKALNFLQADLVLFTGDFGNENVDLVKSVSELDIPKAAILGNHDAWNTKEFSCKKKDAVELQLEFLGEQHVGYRRLDLPSLELSIVGGRPFSNGGDRLFRPKLLSSRYGVDEMNGSAGKICEAALGASTGDTVILLAHNGPTGLGSRINDICGRDWVNGGGDHGDPDLAQALSHLKKTANVSIPLVVFGHMHKELAHRGGIRKMIAIDNGGTIYLNGAIVPRVKCFPEEAEAEAGGLTWSDGSTHNMDGTLRAFTVIEIQDGKIIKITETWVLVVASNLEIAEETILYEK